MKPYEEKPRETIMLTLTERCNLSCSYCYERNKRAAIMPVEIATGIIDKALQREPDKELHIQFHGGEPLMAFKELKKICEKTWSKGPSSRPYIFLCTSNGTLFKGDIKKWFEDNRDAIWVGLSLDGTPEMHNKNRSNSFKEIDLDFFLRCWPAQPVKMTVSKETLPDLAKGVQFLHEKGFMIAGNLAFGLDWKKEDYALYHREMIKLADYYLANPEIRHSLFFADNIHTLHTYEKEPDYRWCAAGKSMCCYDMSGVEYACHVFMPSVQEDTPVTIEKKAKAQELLRNLSSDITAPVCKACEIYSLCPSCYGMNYISERGALEDKGEANCAFAMIRAKTSAYLYANMLRDRDRYPIVRSLQDYQVLHLIEGIEAIDQAIPDRKYEKKINGEIKGMGL